MKKIVFGLVAAVIGIGISPIGATASDGCSKRSSPNAAIEACTRQLTGQPDPCLLYTSDAADDDYTV